MYPSVGGDTSGLRLLLGALAEHGSIEELDLGQLETTFEVKGSLDVIKSFFFTTVPSMFPRLRVLSLGHSRCGNVLGKPGSARQETGERILQAGKARKNIKNVYYDF